MKRARFAEAPVVVGHAFLVVCLCALLGQGPVLGADGQPAAAAEPIAAAPEEEADANPDAAREASDRGRIEEIVVTAEKRATDAQSIPIAVTTFSGAFLEEAGLTNVESLSFQIPNFHYGEIFGFAAISIRGVSPSAGDPSTAVHVDGVYQNNPNVPAGLTFYDLERIEVLRGPQGTLYGRNATGGSLNVITRSPQYEVDAFGDIMWGSQDELFTRGVLNLPIVDEKIALRVAAYQRLHDGYQQNLLTEVRNHWADDAQDWGLRAQLRLDPVDSLDMVVRGSYAARGGVGFATKINGDFPEAIDLFPNLAFLPEQPVYLFAEPNPADPREIKLDDIGTTNAAFWSVNSTIRYDLPELPVMGDTTFKIVGSYQTGRRDNFFDSDMSSSPLLESSLDDMSNEWTVDAHWSNAGDGSLTWVVGGFYLGSDQTFEVNTFSTLPIWLPPVPPPTRPPDTITSTRIAQRDDNDLSSWAVYGQATYRFIEDRLGVTLGLRYSADRKRGFAQDDEIAPVVPPLGEICTFPGLEDEREDSWDQVTGALKVEYTLTDRNMIYASGSRGYKAGTIEHDVPLQGGCGPPPRYAEVENADPETIWAFEIGSKNRFLDHRLQANFTFFYYDYNDLQVSQIVDTAVVTQNAAEARVLGLEAEFIYRPIDEVTLVSTFGYLNARYTEFMGFLAEDPDTIRDFSGNRLGAAPDFTVSLVAIYDLDLHRYGTLSPQIQFFGSSELYFRPINSESDRQPAYTRTNIRVRWTSPGERLYVEGFVDNVADQDVKALQLVGPNLIGSPLWTVYEAPRTWGLRLSVSL